MANCPFLGTDEEGATGNSPLSLHSKPTWFCPLSWNHWITWVDLQHLLGADNYSFKERCIYSTTLIIIRTFRLCLIIIKTFRKWWKLQGWLRREIITVIISLQVVIWVIQPRCSSPDISEEVSCFTAAVCLLVNLRQMYIHKRLTGREKMQVAVCFIYFNWWRCLPAWPLVRWLGFLFVLGISFVIIGRQNLHNFFHR
jgi:hypothetical protein